MTEPEPSAETVAGCWVTAGWDMNYYDVRPHASEMGALRYLASDPWMGRDVYFVPWGEPVHDKYRYRPAAPNDGSIAP